MHISSSSIGNSLKTQRQSGLQVRFLFCFGVLFAGYLFLSGLHLCYAQTIPLSPKAIRDNRGKDFWLGFPRNHHQTNISLDRLYISIASERPTRGRIEFRQNGNLRVEQISLGMNDFYTLELPAIGLEINDDQIGQRSFHITTDEEVAVYGLSVANTTSDAFLAFPTDVLGKEYVITSYPSNLNIQGNNVNQGSSTMSQFALLAVEDSTVITIIPTARVWGRSTVATFTVTLNKGETYLISNYLEAQNVLLDFTGSRVIASKPLVVYAGHERAAIPVGQASSRDCLIEQMLPVEAFGKTALVVPYPQPGSGGRPDYFCDFVRIVAAYDNTVVYANGVTVATLKAGGYHQMQISTEASVITSEPSMVTGYKCSVQGVANTPGMIGDPFIAVIPPVEQYLTRYRFSCVQGTQIAAQSNRLEPAFVEHYVTVIVPSTKATTVVLDGRNLTAAGFRRIPQSDYSYASIPVGEGVHNISADTTFGITVAGYGRANSYGYIGGQRFEFDIRPPQFVVNRSCTGLSGKIFDSAFTNSKLFFYDTLRNQQQNIRFRFGNLPRPADSLSFEADLQNIYEDGALGLIAVDSLDLRTVQRFVVPGFTVHLNPTIRTNAVVSTSSVMRLATGKDYCFKLNLSNYGATNQTIQNVGFASGVRQFTTQAMTRPLRIEPSSRGTVEYCFRADEDGIFTDTLTISNGCITRPILAIRIEARQDRLAPTLQRNADSCNRTINLDLADNRLFDAGLAPLELTSTNFNIRQTFLGNAADVPDSTKRPTRLTLTVENPRLEASYKLVAKDSVGNTTELSETIPAFTLRFLAASDTVSGRYRELAANISPTSTPVLRGEYAFSAIDATFLTCATILVQNYGSQPFSLNNAALRGNIQFSLPLSQFPFVIPAGSTRPLTVCFNPMLVSNYRDTLSFAKYCIEERIALVGEGLKGNRIAGSRCFADVQVSPQFGSGQLATSPQGIPQSLAVSTFPDPARDEITLHLDLQETEQISIRLYTMLGTLAAELPEQALGQGAWDVRLRLSALETGTYFCEVRSLSPSNKRWRGLVRIAR